MSRNSKPKLAFALCLALAFASGAAVTAMAQGSIAGTYWYTGSRIMELPRQLRMAYAAGAHDMLAAVMQLALRDDVEQATQILVSADSCIDRRTAGTLGQYTDWAESIWRGRPDSAALLLLLEACR